MHRIHTAVGWNAENMSFAATAIVKQESNQRKIVIKINHFHQQPILRNQYRGNAMLQCNIRKWSAQLDRLMQKGEPWRRKQYKKARFRKRASRYKLYAEIDYAEMTMNEPWEWKYHQIWVL